VYRQATEAITKHRLSLVESAGGDIVAAERGLGGMIETTLEEAKAEEGVAGKMVEWKA
jgi:NADH dehydrogenase (ubiquinone) 1 alpha subcomplex subunit 5